MLESYVKCVMTSGSQKDLTSPLYHSSRGSCPGGARGGDHTRLQLRGARQPPAGETCQHHTRSRPHHTSRSLRGPRQVRQEGKKLQTRTQEVILIYPLSSSPRTNPCLSSISDPGNREDESVAETDVGSCLSNRSTQSVFTERKLN